MSRANSEMWSPMRGILIPKSMIESYALRSSAHRKDCWRSSIEAGKNLNIAQSIGNWSSIGRQPPIGLIPARL